MTILGSQPQPARSDYEGACASRGDGDGRAVREVLDRIGDKWSLLVIVTLNDGLLRFTELQRHIPGISQRMLTLTLRQLERDGLVARTVHAEVPPRVEYELTDVGRTLIQPSMALAGWAIENYPRITDARERFDANSARAAATTR
ncbi:winged helix-turn-helix transcriptional regulator [Agromyces sp. NPDC057865]|uniref:winged helix-turn-helix transcriptional regulator n=1 Tax=Agromyces sp. NPDC057865 TaxID=3346267 RepID=UPI00366D66EE